MLRKAVLAGLGICVLGAIGASTASAAGPTGYLSLSAGAAFANDDISRSDVTSSETGEPLPDSTLSLDTGWSASPAIGVYLGQFRVEFQYTVQTNDISGLDLQGTGKYDFDGMFHSNLFMLNAYYDIPLDKRLSIYVGAGAGALYATFDGNGSLGDQTYTIKNQNGTAFAYEVMAGLEYKLTPMLSVFGGYRGWSALDLDAQQSTLDMPWFHIAELGFRVSF